MTEHDPAASDVPASVLAAFGVTGPARRLAGGEGRCVRVGPAVLKPTTDGPEASWCAELLARLREDGFRLARPLRAGDGRWVVDGWSASRFVEGEPVTGRWTDLFAAGRAFHQSLSSEPRPTFLDTRTHPWAIADRVAWQEATAALPPDVAPLVSRLESARAPVEAVGQLVHGDLRGNVLFAAGRPPAIIDFSPYWRPPAYADAVVAVDGMLWYGAGPDVLSLAWSSPDFPQLLVRALIFRLVARGIGGPGRGVAAAAELAAFESATAAVEALLR
jgi:uncharacterized protein (TIGR02569 family)